MSLLVFDFDWSLVNENSDTYIFKVLDPSILEEIKNERTSLDWTELMDAKILKLQEKAEYTLDDIAEVMSNLPVLNGMVDTVKRANAGGAQVVIVSDANHFYIDSFLNKHGLKGMVTEIHTNRSPLETIEIKVDENESDGEKQNIKNVRKEVIRIKPYHSDKEPHGCELCPPNMCKGKIIDDLITRFSPSQICYVGDGSGDFCAATRLRDIDTLLVRNDKNYRSALGLVKRIEREKDRYSIKADVVHWTQGEEVLNSMTRAFHNIESSEV